jgi:hypothetical protein
MSLDFFYSGKINSNSAYNFCNDELAEIEEIFKENNICLNALESSGSEQDDLGSIWRLIMQKINIESKIPDRLARKSEVIEFVESVVQKRVNAFPVNMLRFSLPKYEKSRVAWHQDSQTWPGIERTFPRLQNSQVVTFWTSLTRTDDNNGLSFALDMPSIKFQHEFSEGQGYFNANLGANNITRVETIFGDPYTGIIFGQNRLHCSAVGGSIPRVSIDLRFYCEH